MYERGTILALKEPRSTEDLPFAYDRVEVIGQSPVSHSGGAAEWSGTNAQGVIVQPLTEFGSTIDEPYGKLRDLYEVESIPEKIAPQHKDIRVIDSTSGEAGLTPEEQFENDRGEINKAKPDKPKRKPSPLGDEATASALTSPLDVPTNV